MFAMSRTGAARSPFECAASTGLGGQRILTLAEDSIAKAASRPFLIKKMQEDVNVTQASCVQLARLGAGW